MNQVWKEFIQPYHPHIVEDTILSFGYPKEEIVKAKDHTVLVDLSYMGLIKISGQNAQSFLQGQLSCDLNQVNASQSQLGAYCTHQGRMIAAFRIFQIEDDYYLYLPRCTIPSTLAQLQKVAIFSKVMCSDMSDSMVCIGMAGVNAFSQMKSFVSLSDVQDSVHYDAHLLTGKLIGSPQRYLMLAEPQIMINLWKKIKTQCVFGGSHLWRFLNITSGIPSIYQQSQTLFLPNRLNFHLINGINFNKGCYVGQEVIARLHYKGTLKHHMYRIWLDTTDKLEPAMPIQDDNGNQLGHIVDHVLDPVQGSQALAVMPIKSIDQPNIKLHGKTVLFKLLELPYSLGCILNK